MSVRLLFVVLLALTVTSAKQANADTREQVDFFERKIRPVLVEHCYECHSAESDVVQGGLRVDHPDEMRRGGDTGTAVEPGEPNKSLLLTAIRYDEMEMPPSGKLSDSVIRDFERWIKLGAIDPRHADPVSVPKQVSIDWNKARQFWSFQKPKRHQLPKTKNSKWANTAIDSFVLRKLESAGLTPNGRANKRVLIRRISFDLTGLPPTVDDVERFENDNRPGALQRAVDRLLSDPQHAERWTRMWLDVVRYAEDQAHIVGKNTSLTYPNAYRYRDWVLKAIARDQPYHEFVRDQLAADIIYPDDPKSHLGLGLLGLGPKYYRRGDAAVMADEWEDRVDTVSRGLLGLTVACARCHDHKYDPIPTSDYYALAGVFAGTDMYNRPLPDKEKNKDGQAKKPEDSVHIVREGKPRNLNVMIRGDVNNKGPIAPRQFLTVLCADEPTAFESGSGRIDLANAISNDQNPLTARVIVNRVWMRLMGNPLVATPSNFGALGESPTHPELLDDLSVRFMQQGWSLKWLQREIIRSSTYQQSSDMVHEKHAVDPDNRLLWRMPKRRLTAEGYRDALLMVAGRLDNQFGGKSMQPDQPDSVKRTVYSRVSRLDLNPMLARFDFPDPNAHSAGRYETTTPLQKLFLLNSPFLVAQANALTDRLEQYGGSYRSKIEAAYKILYSRMPSSDEIQLGEKFVQSGSRADWESYAQVLLIGNEMFMID